MFILAGEAAVQAAVCNIPGDIVSVIKTVYQVLKWGIPAILIVVGMFEMGKAITKQKEDEIKKAQSQLVKKAVAALIVFLIPSIVELIIGTVKPGVATDGNWVCVQQILGIEKTTTTDCSKTVCGGVEGKATVNGKGQCECPAQ